MDQLQYDINTYLTSVKMSSKIRVLVEGRDDKSHVSNVISLLCKNAKYKVDVAVDIKGICHTTSKNNRAKIEKAHEIVKGDMRYKKLFFLCDREDRGFLINDFIKDEIDGHYVDGQLSWTLGHSIENYFLSPDLLGDGLRYLTPSAHKNQAIAHFMSCFEPAMRIIAALTLAARKFGSVSYPCGVISWKNLKLDQNEGIKIEFSSIKNPQIEAFEKHFYSFETCVKSSELNVCVQLCRGHTAMVLIKRVFAACLFFVMKESGDKAAESEANIFDSLNESLLSNALAEAWIRKLSLGEAAYPLPLVEAVAALT